MPQMMPINWIILYSFFLLIYMFFFMKNYYINMMNYNHKSNNNLSPIYYNWTW
uniref:ATP synthase F0 subunit 8 n=1 Tax=Limnocentropus hysbald TaxID=1875661 RepID=UPI0022DCDE79|nr:ATP synthase F0 subunit 8 [Limnocentropus hysbald]UZZ44120.1 ATP synthase F0 subunit 8 [Limnocentropus hysbald]